MWYFLTAILFFFQACSPKLKLVEPSSGRTLESYQAVGKEAMVATLHKDASEVGLAVLKKGGNAVDAAIAVSFALSVLCPQWTGIGGGGFMLAYNKKDNKTVVFNFREFAPFKAKRDMYIRNGKADTELSQDGALAVAVPRLVAGLGDIYDHYASKKISWPELIQPAIQLAEGGFQVYPHLAYATKERQDVLSRFKASAQIFLPQGKPLQEGDTLVQKDLAKTLKKIAEKGWAGFYEGDVAAAIIRSVQLAGGILTVDDLWHIEPIEMEPIEGTYRGYKIVSMPPPSSGGITLLEILNILEQKPLSRWGPYNLKTVHVVAEAMRRAFLDRARYLGDPHFVKVPTKGLIAKEYAKTLAESIDLRKATPSEKLAPPELVTRESDSTTHFSIVDTEGNAVASTQTINTLFGSGMVVQGTGIVLNNEMDDFSIQPGVPNAYGLVGSEANSIMPGKKPLSSMAPTFVFNPKGELVMVVGAKGGPRIITSVLHTIFNQIDFKAKPLQAVAAKRYHHQWLPDELQYEPGLFSEKLTQRLTMAGHLLKEGKASWLVTLIAKSGEGWIGVSDPRGFGSPLGY
ncbi:MAG: gamma-glutamyltransferase [Deltaproteobacteria bacterium RIFCSPLOWO2_12_FULL_44_12]|nr:MAG: gamma-glutamyltransferase [Deltaproteobacteria bacterium RIFCSPHIGHO2_01_FULL_43_49]OGQ14192.1 MAG: gamma-glutamyltransferase [Deltaproteobacteria bacterium RIFCSPHIGHO2_02_FULL_44_53]OGQ27408.1 MAG: gamma-glutamyltransferase [Deltaproteobacteria bacterium RIFCSPHIGHO2_12_FULL_44_21]OGQ30656.1 MAG: gamma-glutamyltransferase [Deltaproteobacteria bacterium RIFCSPLOWO2_01_FULL_45_74]OGQ42334.1 MAG: gamma-glutamyltransferase [Deltaproteobacteria bacterium RIFCSPLOWO2_02_FULL_44_34]OGQ69247